MEVHSRIVKGEKKTFKITKKCRFRDGFSDVSYINFEQIINIISTPLLKREQNREYYYFDNDIDVLEK